MLFVVSASSCLGELPEAEAVPDDDPRPWAPIDRFLALKIVVLNGIRKKWRG